MPDRQQAAEPETMSRREFTVEAALAVLAGCVITVSDACSKNSTAPTTPPSDITGAISANHNHAATVTAAQITAGSAITLNIQGTAAHPHTVALSAGDFQTLRNRQPITRDSSSDASNTFGVHSHSVTFTPV